MAERPALREHRPPDRGAAVPAVRVPLCLAAALACGLTGLSGLTSPASADQGFHTAKYDLGSVAGAPLRNGTVIDIHANGRAVYAQERYHLVGAAASTTFDVTLVAYADLGCGGAPLAVIPETSFSTDARGNGHGSVTFTPAEVAKFRDPNGGTATYGLRWVLRAGDADVYATGCEVVSLD
jgi:hypothetical protein